MQTTPHQDNSTNIIPSSVLLGVAGLGALVALGVALTQRQFSLLGFGGLGVMVVALIAWFVQNPRQARDMLRGRAFTYGGTAALVTAVLLVALVLLYIVIRQQGWRADLTESGAFSLPEQSRQVAATLGADPTTPPLQITAFYGINQASLRDRATLLFDSIVNASGGKVSYQFIDPDQNPLVLEQYGGTPGSIFVEALNEDGTPNTETRQQVQFLEQSTLVNSLITASAGGDFRAFFLTSSNSIGIDDSGPFGASVFVNNLRTRYKWTVEAISLLELAREDNALQRARREADGHLLVIAGGSQPIPDDQLSLITDYLDEGGHVVIFAAQNLEGGESLANAANLSAYLEEKFGIRANGDLVIDPSNSIQGSLFQVLVGSFGAHSTVNSYVAQQDALWLSAPQSLLANETRPPRGVSITPLASTSGESYAKRGLVLGQEQPRSAFAKAEGDAEGPFTVAVLAERALDGAKVALFASDSLLYNQYLQLEQLGVRNSDLARRVMFWASGYDQFSGSLAALPAAASEQDLPVIGDDLALLNIRNVSVIFLPFGILALGVGVWWLRRERAPL